MEEQQITDILNFVNSVLQNKSDAEHRSIQSALDLAEGVARTIAKNKHLVPYHLNLIDELHINENGHSRILYKLLEYRNPNGDYIFLKSLLKYISKNCEAFEKICVTNPKITQELCRIDLWVRDKDYAIIFENKVYNATDQEAQIARYIECTQGNGCPLDKIFVVYMPQKDDKDPADDSWGEYKEAFASRYVKFSFRNGVLPWLKSDVLSSIPDKDKLLKSAIEQYVDYLEGLFKQRESDKILNTMLENYITEQLGFTGLPEEYYTKLICKCKDVKEVLAHLENARDRAEKVCWERWRNCLLGRYGKNDNCEIVFESRRQFPQVGVRVKIMNKYVYLILEREERLYYGVKANEGDGIDENIEKELADILATFTETQEGDWYQWDYVESSLACEQLIKLIDTTLEHIKK